MSMDIPESALLASYQAVQFSAQQRKPDDSHLDGFLEGWTACLVLLLSIYGEPETKELIKQSAGVRSVPGDQLTNPDLQTRTPAGSSDERGVA
jgi:hypothetical protein